MKSKQLFLFDTARCALAVALATGLYAVPAQATLSVDNITLSAPGGIIGDSTPLSLVNTPVASGDGVKALPGDGSAIGSFMLPSESISFSGNVIDVVIAAGAVDGSNNVVTGYLGDVSGHALYAFNNLSVDGQGVASFSASVVGGGISSPGSLSSVVTLVSPSQLTINLDNLIFTDLGNGQSNDFVELKLTLQPLAVPELDTLPLMAGGLGLLFLVSKRLPRARV